MNTTFIVSAVNFIPAAFLLYFILGRYEGYFKDNKAFFMIIFGLGVGMALGLFSLFLPLGDILWGLSFVGLFELIKLTILIQKPFRLNHDTTFYGMALGIGMGAMYIMVSSFYAGLVEIGGRTILFIFLLSFNYTFINSSTGALIGFGSYKGEFWKYFFRGFVFHGILGILMTIIWSGLNESAAFSLLIIGCIFNVLVALYIYNVIFDKTIPDEIKRLHQKID